MDDESLQLALEYINETADNKEKSLQQIKQWFANNPQLNGRTEDKYILPFLRGCKYDIKKTKTKLSNYYNMKRDFVEWFADRDPEYEMVRDLVSCGVCVPLKLSHENMLVVIVRSSYDPKLYHPNDVFKVILMIFDIAVMEFENAQIFGIASFVDFEEASFAHAKQFSFSFIKKLAHCISNLYCRPQQIQFVNASFYMNVILNLFKSFLPSKIKGRLHVHAGVESMHKVVDKRILPKEYGGDGETMEELSNYWYEKLVSYKEWFKEDEKYKAE